jgi:hypothetical protein
MEAFSVAIVSEGFRAENLKSLSESPATLNCGDW